MSDDLRDQQYAQALAKLRPELHRRAKALSGNELSQTTLMAELAAAYKLGVEQERERIVEALRGLEGHPVYFTPGVVERILREEDVLAAMRR